MRGKEQYYFCVSIRTRVSCTWSLIQNAFPPTPCYTAPLLSGTFWSSPIVCHWAHTTTYCSFQFLHVMNIRSAFEKPLGSGTWRLVHTEEKSYICGMHVHDVTSSLYTSLYYSVKYKYLNYTRLAGLPKMVIRKARQFKNINISFWKNWHLSAFFLTPSSQIIHLVYDDLLLHSSPLPTLQVLNSCLTSRTAINVNNATWTC